MTAPSPFPLQIVPAPPSTNVAACTLPSESGAGLLPELFHLLLAGMFPVLEKATVESAEAVDGEPAATLIGRSLKKELSTSTPPQKAEESAVFWLTPCPIATELACRSRLEFGTGMPAAIAGLSPGLALRLPAQAQPPTNPVAATSMEARLGPEAFTLPVQEAGVALRVPEPPVVLEGWMRSSNSTIACGGRWTKASCTPLSGASAASQTTTIDASMRRNQVRRRPLSQFRGGSAPACLIRLWLHRAGCAILQLNQIARTLTLPAHRNRGVPPQMAGDGIVERAAGFASGELQAAQAPDNSGNTHSGKQGADGDRKQESVPAQRLDRSAGTTEGLTWSNSQSLSMASHSNGVERHSAASSDQPRSIVLNAANDLGSEGPLNPPRSLTVRIQGAPGRPVDVRFVESRGTVKVTVRTEDNQLASAIATGLPGFERGQVPRVVIGAPCAKPTS